MPLIPANVILIWAGTHAGIPAGFSRETALDSKYPKGTASAVEPNVAGGNANHEHTVTGTHSHTMVNHTHTVTINAHSNNVGMGGGGSPYTNASHAHDGTIASGAVTSGTTSAVGLTYSSVSNDPPYYEVIYIKSDGSRGAPDSAIGLWDGSAVLPTNWENCNGANTTPNLTDKYLKGAGTGANAGATGGSYINTHTLTHGATHTSSHAHANVVTSTSATTGATTATGGNWLKAHAHTLSFSTTAITVSGDPSVVTTETVEPAYKKLMALQNQNGQESTPKGIIGLWKGALNAIPVGWSEVTSMREKHLKIAVDSSEIGDIGGNNTHVHDNNVHNHSEVGTHTHTVTGLAHTGVATDGDGGGNNRSRDTATAHGYSITAEAASFNNVTTSADSVNNEPPYLTVAFIKLTQTADAGFLLNFV